MKVITNYEISYYSEQFGISNKKIIAYSKEEEGEQKKILAFTILSFTKKFIENENPIKKKGVTYLEVEDIANYFGFRKDTVYNWESEKRKRLKRCLLNTPKAYVEYIITTSKLQEELQALFP